MSQIRCNGAPIDQGRAQGLALRSQITGYLYRLRERQARLDRAWIRRQVRRGPLRGVTRHLPQQSERQQGIAAGAGVRDLELWTAASQLGLAGRGYATSDAALEAWLELPAETAPLLSLRQSDPDAGGFPSVELVLGSEAGCLAGVNRNGVAVVCVEDVAGAVASLRPLAQELLFRASDLAGGLDHLRRRAAYLGGDGALLVASPDTEPCRVRCVAGRLDVQPIAAGERRQFAEPLLRVEPADKRIVWRDAAGKEHGAGPPETIYDAA